MEDPTLGELLGPLPKAGVIRPEILSPDVTSRLEQARAEIARRRALAEGSGMAYEVHTGRPGTARFIGANDPAHVLAVLAAAEATLDRHPIAAWWDPEFMDDDDPAPCGTCTYDARRVLWPCPDAKAVLDLYAPEAGRG